MSKRALGKGLDALIQVPSQDTDKTDVVLSLLLSDVRPNQDQPRKHIDDKALEELAGSIREKGVIQPIIVEKKGDTYLIVAGERRFRAAQQAGLQEIPAIVRSFSQNDRLIVSLIENIQRENLNAIEEAQAFETILRQTGMNQDDLARQVGKSRPAIANSLRLLKLPETMKLAVRDGDMSSGHARAILSVVNPSAQQTLFSQIMDQGISVREAEAKADQLNGGARGATRGAGTPQRGGGGRQTAPEIQEVEQQFIESLGTKVQLKGTLVRGKIEISYFSKDDLDRIYDLLIHTEE